MNLVSLNIFWETKNYYDKYNIFTSKSCASNSKLQKYSETWSV